MTLNCLIYFAGSGVMKSSLYWTLMFDVYGLTQGL